jgi:conjugal transfer pilus assembly protein TraU
MGNEALCGGYIDPMFPKTQYKWSMFFPIPETGTSSITYTETNEDGTTSEGSLPTSGAHVTGQNVFLWGEDRQIPAVGEDSLYVVWRWLDCCSQFVVPGQ